MLEIRRNPDAPLRRRKETAFGGVHTENAADGVGKTAPNRDDAAASTNQRSDFPPAHTTGAATPLAPESFARGKVVR